MFNGGGLCFMGAEYVSWERNMFHGSGICFMGVKSTEYGRQIPRGSVECCCLQQRCAEAIVTFIERRWSLLKV